MSITSEGKMLKISIKGSFQEILIGRPRASRIFQVGDNSKKVASLQFCFGSIPLTAVKRIANSWNSNLKGN